MDATTDLYCAEQISIPPTFPYLLRQYAKAAIRTQPIDLLKWSTTYFRCLSLNVPPPVKTRLEYPIPDDWYGLTPGWVKSLYLQIHPNASVDFKILWDRWVGSCLQHDQLIQILCLGDFRDPKAVPWLRFIGLCAAMITKSLTQTMIMVCEILTEEPEGASASITIENFLDIYKFLADIDASKGQWLKNIYFPVSYLELCKEKREKFEEAKQFEESESEEEICSEPIICQIEVPKRSVEVEITKEVSCPSIKENDYQKIEDYLEEQEKLAEAAEEEGTEEEEEKKKGDEDKEDTNSEDLSIEKIKNTEKIITEDAITDVTDDVEDTEDAAGGNTQDTDEVFDKEKERQETLKTEERQIIADMDEKTLAQYEKDKLEGKKIQLVAKKPEPQEPDFEEKGLLEDLAKLKALQIEMRGEDDQELEEFKKELMEQLEKTPSELEAISHFASKLQDREEKVLAIIRTEDSETIKSEQTESSTVTETEEEKTTYEEIYVDRVPGISSKVPEDLVREVERYMKEMARQQHGMVMPRNIRHYDCPPLEDVEELEKEVLSLDLKGGE